MANSIEFVPVDPSAGNIVKNDRAGRTRYTRQYKEEVLEAFESSSLSAAAFARHCGIKYSTYNPSSPRNSSNNLSGIPLSRSDLGLFSLRSVVRVSDFPQF